MNIQFPAVTATVNSEVIILQSQRPLHTLASAVVGGGFTHTQHLINRHVDKNYNHSDPVSDLQAFAETYGISGNFVGLMTAAYLDTARAITLQDEDFTVAVVVTAGLSNPTSAGLSPPATFTPGTINIMLLVDAGLTPAAMVNAVITATEAKTDVLQRHNVRTPQGHPATGTSTDAIAVACTGRGNPLPYAGPATPAGRLIGQCVRQSLTEAISSRAD